MNGIFICQIKYTLDLLDETWIMGIRPVETLMVQIYGRYPGKYERLVGRLINLTITQPDAGFVVSVVT